MGALEPRVGVDEVEQEIVGLLRVAERGGCPAVSDVAAARSAWSRLPRSDGSIPAWRLAELDVAVRELVRLVPLPSTTRRAEPATRPTAEAPNAMSPRVLEEQFDVLRRRVDALHDCIEAGRRPTLKTIDDMHHELIAHRHQDDAAEIRQMIDDVRGFRRAVLAMSRPAAPARLTSSQSGRGFWGQPIVPRPARERRRVSRRRRTNHVEQVRESATALERVRLDGEARQLRDRAHRFAAAVPAGRQLPQREVDRLFLHFKVLRPKLDAETRALNDAAIRRLIEAVEEDRQRRL